MLKKNITKTICAFILMILFVCVFEINIGNSIGFGFVAEAAETLVWPVPGYHYLTRGYSAGGHTALDISQCNGQTVVAAHKGTVVNIFKCEQQHYGSYGDCYGFGTGLIIKGTDNRFYIYAHMQGGSIPSNVYRGATVEAGQKIGQVGTTGNSTGPHLHFGIAQNEKNKWSGDLDPEKEVYVDPVLTPYKGWIDKPLDGEVHNSDVVVSGWSLYVNGVTKVTCVVNGKTYTCLQEARNDVAQVFPGYPTGKEGFSCKIPSSALKEGTNTIEVRSYNGTTVVGTECVSIKYSSQVSGVKLNKTDVIFKEKGETVTLTATVSPSNAPNKSVTWKSSDTSVATVSNNGVVKAVGNGTATITVTTESGAKTATCKVAVAILTSSSDGWYYSSELPSDITSSKYEIQYQNVYQKYATSSPGTSWKDTGKDKTEYIKSGSTYESNLPLTTSNTVKLDHYYYYHFCAGSNANFAQTSTYTHYDAVSPDLVYVQETYTDIDDNRYQYYHLKWNDGTNAFCNSSKGTCDGTYGTHGNRTYYWYKMYVYQNYTAKTLNLYQKTSAWETTKDSSAVTVNYRYRLLPTGVSLDKTNVKFTREGSTVQLYATVKASDVGSKNVTWKSSDVSVATVSSGKVTAVAPGVATITATCGKYSATCRIVVEFAEKESSSTSTDMVTSTGTIEKTETSTNATNLFLTSGESESLKDAYIEEMASENEVYVWKSSNPSIVQVSDTGVVTAVNDGTAIITALSAEGTEVGTYEVIVEDVVQVAEQRDFIEIDDKGEKSQDTSIVDSMEGSVIEKNDSQRGEENIESLDLQKGVENGRNKTEIFVGSAMCIIGLAGIGIMLFLIRTKK